MGNSFVGGAAFAFPIATAIAIGACGGRVIVDQDAGAVSGTTGAGGSGTVASSSASGDGGCPAMAPQQGAPCANEGQVCSYGMLCASAIATCQGGVWNISAPHCPATPCPSPPPNDGDPCPTGPATCDYNLCDTTSASTLHAACNDGAWSITEGSCPAKCAPGMCQASQVCLVMTAGDGIETFGCANDPCNGVLDCACAKQLCSSGYDCAIVDGTDVACTCKSCP